MIKNNYLFNFAVSYLGGGYKRLWSYAAWFNNNGGAYFIIHPACTSLIEEFPNNHFFVVHQSKLQRIFNDAKYLKYLENKIGKPDLYYAYGIPVYFSFGKVNWFHLSNVLPLISKGMPISLKERIKFILLGHRIKRNYKHAQIISAESKFSLDNIESKYKNKFFLSVNGSDDELIFLKSQTLEPKKSIALILGTAHYKALNDSFCIFKMLKKDEPMLKLVIIGDPKNIPTKLLYHQDIIVTGKLTREKVIAHLKHAKYYISTTYIENSYNAAAEGIYFAEESFISDIGPHQELLVNNNYSKVTIKDVERKILWIKKSDLTTVNLKTWDEVVKEMIEQVQLLIKK